MFSLVGSKIVSTFPPVNFHTTVLSAASITPPVVENILAAPVPHPISESNSWSSIVARSIPFNLKSFAASLVVNTTSTSFP